MTYPASAALQGAIYEALRADPVLWGMVGDAIYDAMPVTAPSGVYVALGPEDVSDAGDMTGCATRHDFVISVLSGAEESGGFAGVKAAAGAVAAALEGAPLALDAGQVAGLWFLRSRARRVDVGRGRRVDMTFRATVDMGLEAV
ncbi:DUF3168 domain-containing protein [uncultured Paracoccus sp.]|uniref:DUF3168 domain-containing protein n=1 Tax=uncultured Paracoccus sp. TaxID=189685 RepID=UPI002619AACB|nr:DUF3168 domain-containing protein [uncultured Paracoccus sp.]